MKRKLFVMGSALLITVAVLLMPIGLLLGASVLFPFVLGANPIAAWVVFALFMAILGWWLWVPRTARPAVWTHRLPIPGIFKSPKIWFAIFCIGLVTAVLLSPFTAILPDRSESDEYIPLGLILLKSPSWLWGIASMPFYGGILFTEFLVLLFYWRYSTKKVD